MGFEIQIGNFDKMGVVLSGNDAIFTFEAEKEEDCAVILIDRKTEKEIKIPIPKDYCLGSIRSVTICDIDMHEYYYLYEIDGKDVLDSYASRIFGREVWNDPRRKDLKYRVYGSVSQDHFSWGEDVHPEIRESQVVMYKLHVRGFTKDKGADPSLAGTFQAVEKKIPYLKGLGITTLELMPIYEFEEMPVPEDAVLPDYVNWVKREEDLIKQKDVVLQKKKLNYWGYGTGNYFAVKSSYAREPEKASEELKGLVKKLHKSGMECVMEMYFPENTNQNLILDALRYWVRVYHIDGFHLLGKNLPMTAILQDVLLSRTKIFYMDSAALPQVSGKYRRFYIYKEEYQYPARKILNHINADMREFLDQQKKQGEDHGYVNFMAGNNGFTLADTFMYKDKHNEDNGENNSDGDAWNFSNNYGIEGPTRKRFIVRSRMRQWKNAMIMLFLAQGVPLIWAGDEFGNSQNGNNNAYCQDNEIGWVNWKKNRNFKECSEFVKGLSKFRKEHELIACEKPYTFTDYKSKGYPDLSYHGDNAWLSHVDLGQMSIGLLYNGQYASENENADDIYVAYNFYTRKVSLALPRLRRNWKWYLAVDSSDESNSWLKGETISSQQKYVTVEPQSIKVLVGKVEGES